jgi:hypothetical protein
MHVKRLKRIKLSITVGALFCDELTARSCVVYRYVSSTFVQTDLSLGRSIKLQI